MVHSFRLLFFLFSQIKYKTLMIDDYINIMRLHYKIHNSRMPRTVLTKLIFIL